MNGVPRDIAGNRHRVAQFDVSRTGGSVQVKAGLAGNSQLDSAGAGAELPFPARTAFDGDVAAAGIGVHHAAHAVQINPAGAGAHANLAGSRLAKGNVATAGLRIEPAGHAVPLNVAAAGASPHVAADAVHLQVAGAGVRFQAAADGG